MRAEGARGAWKEGARGEKRRDAREGEEERARRWNVGVQTKGICGPSPLLSSPLPSSPLLRSVRSTNSLARSLVELRLSPLSLLLSLSLRPFRDGALGPSPSLSLYTPFGVSLFFLFRVYTYVRTYVRACTRVACVFVDRWPRDAEGRIFFRMGYLTRWPGQ